MPLIDALLARRSIRRYTDESLPEGALERIVSAGLASETGRNKKPWHFVVVTDPALLERLSTCRESGSAQMLAGAKAAIAVFGDAELSDTWVEDCSIALAHMHLEASALGVGSCWIQGRMRWYREPEGLTTEAFVRELLAVDEPYRLEALLSLGMPDQSLEGRTLDDLVWDKVSYR